MVEEMKKMQCWRLCNYYFSFYFYFSGRECASTFKSK
jgi:hypothetical protein